MDGFIGLPPREGITQQEQLDPAIEASDYFDHLINADEWLAG